MPAARKREPTLPEIVGRHPKLTVALIVIVVGLLWWFEPGVDPWRIEIARIRNGIFVPVSLGFIVAAVAAFGSEKIAWRVLLATGGIAGCIVLNACAHSDLPPYLIIAFGLALGASILAVGDDVLELKAKAERDRAVRSSEG